MKTNSGGNYYDQDIKLVSIYGNNLLSVKFGNGKNQYDKFFDRYNDVTQVRAFFKQNEAYLNRDFWRNIPNIESATRQVIKEAQNLELLLDELYHNTLKNLTPDLDIHFKLLNGEFKNTYEYIPVKSYGTDRPSLLRLYAIKLKDNMYVITGGGIKLGDTIQNSPKLKGTALQEIRRVRDHLICSYSD